MLNEASLHVAVWGVELELHTFLTSVLDVNLQLHVPAVLLRAKSPQYQFGRSLGGPQSLSEQGGEEKKSLPLPGVEPPSRP